MSAQQIPPAPSQNDNDAPGADETQSQAVGEFWSILFTLSVIFALCCMLFLFLRRRRQIKQLQKSYLPVHRSMGQRGKVTINGEPHPVFVVDERRNFLANSSSSISSPVPEIHITLPDEDGSSGQSKPGRVVVVHISELGSEGMTPLSTEPLPKYEKEDSGAFRTIDLERIGGLRENNTTTTTSGSRWS